MAHRIDIYDRQHRYLDSISEDTSLEYTGVENEVGVATLVLPSTFDSRLLQTEGQLAIYRTASDRTARLVRNQMWFIRKVGRTLDKQKIWRTTAVCEDSKTLLKRRISNYHSGSIYCNLKNTPLDDMMRHLVRYNGGPLSIEAKRRYPDLVVSANAAIGPVSSHGFAYDNVLEQLQKWAEEAEEGGTYLSFDVVCVDVAKPAFLFDVWSPQRGNDHRRSSLAPVALSPTIGNIVDVEEIEDRLDEKNDIIAGGQAEGILRSIEEYEDADAIALSPWNRCEEFHNASNCEYRFQLRQEVQRVAREGKAKKTATGKMKSIPGFLFEVNWGFGDLFTLDLTDTLGTAYDVRVSKTQVTERAKKETIEATVEGSLD